MKRYSSLIRSLGSRLLCSTCVLVFMMLLGGESLEAQREGTLEQGKQDGRQDETCKILDSGADLGRGRIIVGCPKIWRSERVFMTLDGLMRDVDSMTIAALQGLDPNEANSAEITQVVNAFNASVKYDQTAAINNKFALEKSTKQRESDLQNFDFAKQNAQRDQDYKKALYDRRDALLTKLNLLQNEENDLLKSGKPSSDDLQSVQAQETAVTKQLGDIKTELAANPTPSAAQIPDQTAPPSSQADQGPTKSLLGDLPDPIKNAIASKLTTPTYPPALRMDNTIELLHQRIARELAVMHDDLIRDSSKYDLYLAQFDVSLLPRHGAKDRVAKLNIKVFDDGEGDVLAYELYPGGSAYNIMRGLDKTTHIGLAGAAQTIVGWGLNASFSHDKQQMRSGLSQSIYVSGFGAGTRDFGWLFGPAPFESFVAPGVRTVHAILAVPKLRNVSGHTITLKVTRCWAKQEKRYPVPIYDWLTADCEEDNGPIRMRLRTPESDSEQLQIQGVSYVPVPLKQTPPAPPGSPQGPTPTGTIEIRFTKEIDPNLTITAGDHLLRRVRDVRGRGLYLGASTNKEQLAGTTNEVNALADSRFGLLESDKPLDPDTWYLMNSKTILLNIQRDTAGTDTFPPIRLIDPYKQGGELIDLLNSKMACTGSEATGVEVRVGRWKIIRRCEGHDDDRIPQSFFLPLFESDYSSGRTEAHLERVSDSGRSAQVRIMSRRDPGQTTKRWLHEKAQVMLDAEDGQEEHHWPLHCAQERGTLLCNIPKEASSLKLPTMKIWLDQPLYLGRPGIWSDADLTLNFDSQAPPPFVVGEWRDIRSETMCEHGQCRWNAWTARIEVKLLERDAFCVREFKEASDRAVSKAQAQRRGLTYETLHEVSGFEQYRYNNASCQYASIFDTAVTEETGQRFLVLTIPYSAAALAGRELHLISPKAQSKVLAVLPELRQTELFPSAVTLAQLEDRQYVLEGERLEAVDHIRLVGKNGAVYDQTALTALGSLAFAISDARGKNVVPAGNYQLQLLVQGIPIQAKREVHDDKSAHLEPLTLNVIEPKVAKPVKPKVAAAPTNGQRDQNSGN